MSLSGTALTEVDAFTAQVFPPAPGTPVLAEDVQAVAQVFANRTHNLQLHKTNKVMASGELLAVSAGAAIVELPPQRPTHAASIDFDWGQGFDMVVPANTLSTDSIRVLDASAAIAPTEGQRIIVRTDKGMGPGISWIVKRESGTIIAKLGADDTWSVANDWTADWSTGSNTLPCWLELVYEGGVWRGGRFGGVVQAGVGW